jgi:hypothetical protein
MDLYTEQEMNEMAASSQQQEFDQYQQQLQQEEIGVVSSWVLE